MLVAVVGETIADRQLSGFRADPANKGKVCDVGLWGMSRHPNYFFEWLGWLAYAVIAVDPTSAYPWGWLALAGPVLMYWLLVHASGIPPLEAHMLRSRGDAFRAYQARVNAFWPGPHAARCRIKTESLDEPHCLGDPAVERSPLPDAADPARHRAPGRARTQPELATASHREERDFAAAMADYPIAEHADAANAQHYELPPEFFALFAGAAPQIFLLPLSDRAARPWRRPRMLALAETVAHADLPTGRQILELGCGWGSLSLFMAERFPARTHHRGLQFACPARAISKPRRRARGLDQSHRHHRRHERLRAPARPFDRVVSVEMFEHMANWRGAARRACRPG